VLSVAARIRETANLNVHSFHSSDETRQSLQALLRFTCNFRLVSLKKNVNVQCLLDGVADGASVLTIARFEHRNLLFIRFD
jgi:hypothetical protein